MTVDAPETLPARLEAAVLAVPGVTAVYPSRPRLATLGGAVRTAIQTRSVDTARVLVEDDGVRVSIGTDARSRAPEVARAVQAACLAVLTAEGRPTGRVEVRVAQIG